MRIPFGSQSYKARSVPFMSQRCVNLIPEVGTANSRSELMLYGSPGLLLFADCGDGPIRGMLDMGDYLYVASGTAVYQIDSGGTATLCTGATLSGSGRVSMDHNGTQLVIVTNPSAYVVVGTTVTQITDADFPGASSVTVVDGYHIFSEPDSGRMFISSLLDADEFDALDFVTAEVRPDNLVRVIADHREVWLFGKTSVEVWVDSGEADFPFRRQDGVFLEKGTYSPFSIAQIDNTLFWLAADGIVYRASGYQPERVSTHGIEEVIASTVVTDAEGWSYTQNGHTFYVLTLPQINTTFCYDAATKLWHERVSGTDDIARWRVSTGINVFSKVIVGDWTNGNVYELDLDTYTENSAAIRRRVVSPPITAATRRARMSKFELEFDAGHGLVTGQGSDPLIGIRTSDDGGFTWGSQKWRSAGAMGEYRKRARWNRMGAFRNRVIELEYSEPTKFALFAADVDVDGLAS